jgi:hypothetical protein
MNSVKKYLLYIFFCLSALNIQAQTNMISGIVSDHGNGNRLERASVKYQGAHDAVLTDELGNFKIQKREGQTLMVSNVGYQTRYYKITKGTEHIDVRLDTDSKMLGEVKVKAKRRKYVRKDNPAVELMKRVIAAKKKNDLENHDYFQYDKYQKITLSVNDIDNIKHDTTSTHWYTNQIEVSPLNGKKIMPLTVDETISKHLYRKDPLKAQDIIMGKRSKGVNTIFQTGEIVNNVMKDLFKDVDINDDFIKLLQHEFTSPIGRTAISFYRYFIEDTTYVDKSLCYHLLFYPNNHQDFGFQGELWVMADSSLHVRRCTLTVPHQSDVNYVRSMHITQEYEPASNGEWCLSQDDMWAEFRMYDFLPDALVVRNTRLTDYNFAPFADKEFRGKAKERTYSMAKMRDESFWDQNRKVALSQGEQHMDGFVNSMLKTKNFGWLMFGLRAVLENFIETSPKGEKSKFDVGPVVSTISNNFVDGWRFRLGGRTMAALNPHLFWSGYAAYGTKSHKYYYNSTVTYSFNQKENSPFEFPMRNITIESEKDVMSPSDKFIHNSKDNFFMSVRTTNVKQMYFYNRQRISFDYETKWGFRFNLGLKTESNQVAGDLHFYPVEGGDEVKKLRTSEFTFGFGYSPNTAFINTKQQRYAVNTDSPDLNIQHTIGMKHFLGGQYKLNLSEINLYKRQWLGSWGHINIIVKGGAEWNKVPFPLLIMPPINLSYFDHEETFTLMKNMEFLNDRYAFWSLAWDMNGKLFNRMPIFHHLKFREYFCIRGMWGHLTDKNNPFINTSDPLLFKFPENSKVMGNQPYWEAVVGIHNIFRMFGIEYVRRLTYTNYDNIHKGGIRVSFSMAF